MIPRNAHRDSYRCVSCERFIPTPDLFKVVN